MQCKRVEDEQHSIMTTMESLACPLIGNDLHLKCIVSKLKEFEIVKHGTLTTLHQSISVPTSIGRFSFTTHREEISHLVQFYVQ